MRSGKFIISFFTVVLSLLIAVAVLVDRNSEDHGELMFRVQSNGNVEKIKCWEDEDDKLYVFLPTYAQMRDIYVSLAKESSLSVGDVELKNGTSCEVFRLNEEYELTGILHGEEINQKLEFVQSANVPTMYIDTQSGNMDYIHEEKGNEEPGLIRVYEKDGVQSYSGELESIKGRGNTTWYAPKKPYSIRLLFEGDLLNMGMAQNWVLLSNARDDTHLLNKLAYDVARDVGMQYTPDCEWIDLYLNGEYVGLYLLVERIEVHPQRVDISKEGSFLVSKEVQSRLEEQGYPHIITQNNMALRIHHSSITEKGLEQIWETAVDAILNEGDWQSVIDVDSWAMRMLVDEVFGNGDGGLVSQFYYGNLNDGKIYAGPVWDMDLCLAQTGWPGGYTNAFLMYRDQLSWIENSLYGKLYQDTQFHNRIIQIYKTTFCPVICKLLEEKFMNMADCISQSAFINSIRWNTNSFRDEVQENYQFLKDRFEFLNSYWTAEEDYCRVRVDPGYSGVWGCFAVKSGENVSTVYGNEIDGWYIWETEKPFDITQPVYEDVAIFHRDNVNALRQSFEAENNEKYIVADSEEQLKLQRVAPILVLIVMFVFLIILDFIRSKIGKIANICF